MLLTLNPGVTNVVRGYLEPDRTDESSKALVDYIVGAGSKAVASTTTYPLVVCKIHLYVKGTKLHSSTKEQHDTQIQSSSETRPGLLGLWHTMYEIYFCNSYTFYVPLTYINSSVFDDFINVSSFL